MSKSNRKKGKGNLLKFELNMWNLIPSSVNSMFVPSEVSDLKKKNESKREKDEESEWMCSFE